MPERLLCAPDDAPVPIQHYLRYSLHDHPVCANRAKLKILTSYREPGSNQLLPPKIKTGVTTARVDSDAGGALLPKQEARK